MLILYGYDRCHLVSVKDLKNTYADRWFSVLCLESALIELTLPQFTGRCVGTVQYKGYLPPTVSV